MPVSAVMERHLAALSEHDLAQLDAQTTDDLRFFTPLGELSKPEYLELMRGLFAAFPDWRFEHGRLRVGWDHATVELRMEGTHTGTLELPIPGFVPAAPTGKAVVLPAQDYHYTISQDRIVRVEPASVPGGGLPGLLEQIGVSPPLPPT